MPTSEFTAFAGLLKNATSMQYDTLYAVVKYNKRLFIMNTETKELLYTPPDFLRLPDRSLLQKVVDKANEKVYLDISDIIWFESVCPRAFGCRKRKSNGT